MSAFRILLTDGLEKEGREILEKSGQVDNLKDITPEELLQKIGDYDAVIVRGRTKLTPEVFAAAGNLKVAGRAGVGVDNINLEAAKNKRRDRGQFPPGCHHRSRRVDPRINALTRA